MATLDQRLKALEAEQAGDYVPMPVVVPECTTDEELARLRRNGRAVFRSGDPELYSEFV